MNQNKNINIDGNITHKIKRSLELSPEIIKIESRKRSRRGINSPLIILYGLILFILLGTFLLFLPFSSKNSENVSLVDSFFVATSAVTVTGLTPFQSEDTWSTFGLSVIMILSFIGGLGFMMGAGFIIYIFFGRRLNLEQKILINESLSDATPSKIAPGSSIRLVINIFIMSVIFQIIGFIIIYFLWQGKNLGNNYDPLFNAIFHSISAYNGSGFDILSDSNGGSIGEIKSNSNLLNITMVLILLGSIGYPFILELFANTKLFLQSKYKEIFFTLNFKVIILGTAIIMIIGSVQFLFSEWTNIATIAEDNIKEKVIYSIFHSITRTAGFSLIDYNLIHNSTTISTLALMFVGGSSLSVAGGIKIGTLSIIIISLIATIFGKEEVTIFKRTISRDITRRALIIFIFSIFLIIFSFIIISSFEPDTIFRELLFECVSAFGNVGLTTGITGSLSDFSKVLMSFLMIVGRFGPMLLAIMFVGKRNKENAKPAYEIVRIG
tara:strand:- start:752 stop:2236 length:1485 start_codon:yes stop_codon:yes gene_type:complete